MLRTYLMYKVYARRSIFVQIFLCSRALLTNICVQYIATQISSYCIVHEAVHTLAYIKI